MLPEIQSFWTFCNPNKDNTTFFLSIQTWYAVISAKKFETPEKNSVLITLSTLFQWQNHKFSFRSHSLEFFQDHLIKCKYPRDG